MVFHISMEHQQARVGGEQQEDASATTQKKKRKEVALYGNYRNYYGYRIGQDLEEDPRLKAMKKEWFEGKECLDIGCNSGVITIAIAQKFSCRSILGIDIDGARVDDAYWTLRRKVKSTRTVPAGGDKLAESNTINCLKDPVAESLNKRAKNDSTAPHRLQEGDFFDSLLQERRFYSELASKREYIL